MIPDLLYAPLSLSSIGMCVNSQPRAAVGDASGIDGLALFAIRLIEYIHILNLRSNVTGSSCRDSTLLFRRATGSTLSHVGILPVGSDMNFLTALRSLFDRRLLHLLLFLVVLIGGSVVAV
jgi:hypothetical protein